LWRFTQAEKRSNEGKTFSNLIRSHNTYICPPEKRLLPKLPECSFITVITLGQSKSLLRYANHDHNMNMYVGAWNILSILYIFYLYKEI